MKGETMRNPVGVRGDGEAIPAVSAAAQAWAAFILAEVFPTGRDVQAAACRVPLLVADLPEADIFDPETTITVETYLKYLRYLCVNSECDCSLGEDETCSHLAAMLRREILPALKPLYRVAVDAAVGRRAWKALAALEDEENEAEHEDEDDKAQRDHEDDEEGLAAAGLEREGYEPGLPC